jgi:hypothetical protein
MSPVAKKLTILRARKLALDHAIESLEKYAKKK